MKTMSDFVCLTVLSRRPLSSFSTVSTPGARSFMIPTGSSSWKTFQPLSLSISLIIIFSFTLVSLSCFDSLVGPSIKCLVSTFEILGESQPNLTRGDETALLKGKRRMRQPKITATEKQDVKRGLGKGKCPFSLEIENIKHKI